MRKSKSTLLLIPWTHTDLSEEKESKARNKMEVEDDQVENFADAKEDQLVILELQVIEHKIPFIF